jgi:hypothetical protein
MKEIIIRFVLIHPLNDHPILGWAMGLIWLAMVGNCIASIRQQPISHMARLRWLLTVVLVPLAGMAAYLFYCLLKTDYSFLKFILGPPKRFQTPEKAILSLPTKN